jgi:hypothetical protein
MEGGSNLMDNINMGKNFLSRIFKPEFAFHQDGHFWMFSIRKVHFFIHEKERVPFEPRQRAHSPQLAAGFFNLFIP